jgi:hypothetical protein
MIGKTLHRKLNIEPHEPHWTPGVKSNAHTKKVKIYKKNGYDKELWFVYVIFYAILKIYSSLDKLLSDYY